jgi:Protein of unknown function (DUF3990)
MSPTISIYAPAPQWRSPRSRYIRLYHGCTSHDEANIRASKIDVARCRIDTDFGRGFYTTTVKYQARQWAWARFYDPSVARIRPNRPVVLRFVVKRHDLARLKFISFVLGGRARGDFWSLVQHCRGSISGAINDHDGPVTLPDGTRWYDLACGPVAAFWRQRFAMQDADQFSFHTPRGIRLLQQLIDRGDKRFFDSEPVI